MPSEGVKTAPPDPAELVEVLDAGWVDFIEHSRELSKNKPYVRASQWRACTRAMTLDMVASEQKPPWTAWQLANFRRGEDRERDLLSDLERIGRNSKIPFRLSEQQQEFKLRDRKGRVVIVGHIDARVQFENGVTMPLECKSWAQNLVARIKCYEDLLQSPWTRSGAHQLLAYLFGTGDPVGMFILDRHGLPLFVPVVFEEHLAEMEDFLLRAEMALDAAEQYAVVPGDLALPAYIEDHNECKRCPYFGAVCNPPIKTEAARVIDDPELQADIARYMELEEAGEEYAALDKKLKWELRGVELALAGSYLVSGKWKNFTKYELPAEVQGKINELKAPYKKTDPKGAFSLSISKL